MLRLCEIIGLTYNDMIDITAYILIVIPFCVFIGMLMYDAFDGICISLRVVTKKVYRVAVKLFRTFGKRRRKA